MDKITFENLPSTNTPINADNLNDLQDNVDNAKLDKTIIITATATSCNDYKDDGVYWFGTADTRPTDSPEASTYGWLQVIPDDGANVRQIWHRSAAINGTNEFKTFVRKYSANTDTWSNWKQYQMVEDSGWVDLPVNNGFTTNALGSSGKLMYRKLNGVVYVKGSVKGFTALNQACATLPSGYRPPTRIDCYGTYGGTRTANMTVSSGGVITLVSNRDGAINADQWVAICTSFVAS